MQAYRRSSVWLQKLAGAWPHVRSTVGAAIVALAAIAGAPSPAASQQIVAIVNGIPITSYDIDQRIRIERLSNSRLTGHKDILDALIDDKVKLVEAKKFGIEPPKEEIERTYAGMASRMGLQPAQLTQMLSSRGIDPNALKSRIRSDIAWQNLVRGRFQASLEVGEGDIQAMLKQSDEERGAVGHVYTLRPILFIVPQGSPRSAFDVRRREAEAFRNRVNGCDESVRLARELRDVAVRDASIRNSASLPAPLRTMLNSLEIGKLTTPEATAQGIEVFALCGKEVTHADTPQKHEARQEIFAKRFDARSKRYLARVRRGAMIEYK